jgi:HlyD family secretion protein
MMTACTGDPDKLEFAGILDGISVRVPALTPGKILIIPVSTGKSVLKGQLLAAIDTTDLIYQRERLSASWEELTIQGQVATANVARAKKDLEYLQSKHDRISALFQTQSVTRQQLDDISNNLQNANTAAANTKQTLATIAAKKRQIDAQINSINKRIDDAAIESPISGMISDIYYEEGEAVPQFGAIMEIIDTRTMEVKIYISEQLLSQVKPGQDVTVNIDGLDNTLSGSIIWISPSAEFTPKTILTPNTRTSLVYAVKISITNEDGVLKDGMPVVINL